MAMDVIVQDAMILMLVKTRSWLLEEQQAAKVVVVRSARYRCCLGGASQLRSPLSARRPDSTLTFHPVFHPDLHQINTQIRINSWSSERKICHPYITLLRLPKEDTANC
jgi:hypothetical protein